MQGYIKVLISALGLSMTLGACATDAGDGVTTAADLGSEGIQLDLVEGGHYTFSPADGALDTTRVHIGTYRLDEIISSAEIGPVLTDQIAEVDYAAHDGRFGFEVAFSLYAPGASARMNSGGGGRCIGFQYTDDCTSGACVPIWRCTDWGGDCTSGTGCGER